MQRRGVGVLIRLQVLEPACRAKRGAPEPYVTTMDRRGGVTRSRFERCHAFQRCLERNRRRSLSLRRRSGPWLGGEAGVSATAVGRVQLDHPGGGVRFELGGSRRQEASGTGGVTRSNGVTSAKRRCTLSLRRRSGHGSDGRLGFRPRRWVECNSTIPGAVFVSSSGVRVDRRRCVRLLSSSRTSSPRRARRSRVSENSSAFGRLVGRVEATVGATGAKVGACRGDLSRPYKSPLQVAPTFRPYRAVPWQAGSIHRRDSHSGPDAAKQAVVVAAFEVLVDRLQG
jgi:hypothetical protein